MSSSSSSSDNTSGEKQPSLPKPVALQQPPQAADSPLRIATDFLSSILPSDKSSFPFDLNGFDLNKTSKELEEKGLFPSIERVLSHASIGFLVGSLAAWAQATKPAPPVRSNGISTGMATPPMSGPVRYEAIANHVAKSGAQVALLGTVFSGTLEVSQYHRQCKDTYTYVAAGFLTGLTSAIFNRSAFKVLVQRSIVLGLASGAYFRISEGSEDFQNFTNSKKSEK